MDETIYRTAELICPKCGKLIDSHTNITKQHGAPRKEDLTVCVGCGSILKYGKKLELIPLSMKELDEISTNDPKLKAMVFRAQYVIRTANAEQKQQPDKN